MDHLPLGATGLYLPRLVFGTSSLGNLYEEIPDRTKRAICSEWFAHVPTPIAVDTAGKYGAGLALEVIGRNLRDFGIPADDVIVSNKLGWLRVPLATAEPTFEPGVWANVRHDAVQRISYRGMFECWEQGCELLGPQYRPQLVSVHDPDEFLAAAASLDDRRLRFGQVLDAYRALAELKQRGAAAAVGVGAKDWRVAQEIEQVVNLDWVMLANSLTIYRHPPELLAWTAALAARGVVVINSAVFNAGFLVGGRYLDYRIPSRNDDADRAAFEWRDRFLALCQAWEITPATACVQFALSRRGVAAVALNTSSPRKIAENVAAVEAWLPENFWQAAREERLID